MCQKVAFRDKCKCVNCLKLFDLDQGVNPFYCCAACAEAKNKETGPAIIDDPHAHVRTVHKANRKRLVTGKSPLSQRW